MNYKVLFALIVAIALAACGEKAPPSLPMEAAPYYNEAGGYTVRYPQGWRHHYWDKVGGVVIYEKGELLREVFERDVTSKEPMILVILDQFDAIPLVNLEGAEDSVTLLNRFLSWLNNGTVRGSKMGPVQTITVGKMEAAVADIFWIKDGDKMAGRAVAIYMEDKVFFIEGAGREERWEAFAPTFQAMVESISFE